MTFTYMWILASRDPDPTLDLTQIEAQIEAQIKAQTHTSLPLPLLFFYSVLFWDALLLF